MSTAGSLLARLQALRAQSEEDLAVQGRRCDLLMEELLGASANREPDSSVVPQDLDRPQGTMIPREEPQLPLVSSADARGSLRDNGRPSRSRRGPLMAPAFDDGAPPTPFPVADGRCVPMAQTKLMAPDPSPPHTKKSAAEDSAVGGGVAVAPLPIPDESLPPAESTCMPPTKFEEGAPCAIKSSVRRLSREEVLKEEYVPESPMRQYYAMRLEHDSSYGKRETPAFPPRQAPKKSAFDYHANVEVLETCGSFGNEPDLLPPLRSPCDPDLQQAGPSTPVQQQRPNENPLSPPSARKPLSLDASSEVEPFPAASVPLPMPALPSAGCSKDNAEENVGRSSCSPESDALDDASSPPPLPRTSNPTPILHQTEKSESAVDVGTDGQHSHPEFLSEHLVSSQPTQQQMRPSQLHASHHQPPSKTNDVESLTKADRMPPSSHPIAMDSAEAELEEELKIRRQARELAEQRRRDLMDEFAAIGLLEPSPESHPLHGGQAASTRSILSLGIDATLLRKRVESIERLRTGHSRAVSAEPRSFVCALSDNSRCDETERGENSDGLVPTPRSGNVDEGEGTVKHTARKKTSSKMRTGRSKCPHKQSDARWRCSSDPHASHNSSELHSPPCQTCRQRCAAQKAATFRIRQLLHQNPSPEAHLAMQSARKRASASPQRSQAPKRPAKNRAVRTGGVPPPTVKVTLAPSKEPPPQRPATAGGGSTQNTQPPLQATGHPADVATVKRRARQALAALRCESVQRMATLTERTQQLFRERDAKRIARQHCDLLRENLKNGCSPQRAHVTLSARKEEKVQLDQFQQLPEPLFFRGFFFVTRQLQDKRI